VRPYEDKYLLVMQFFYSLYNSRKLIQSTISAVSGSPACLMDKDRGVIKKRVFNIKVSQKHTN